VQPVSHVPPLLQSINLPPLQEVQLLEEFSRKQVKQFVWHIDGGGWARVSGTRESKVYKSLNSVGEVSIIRLYNNSTLIYT
jgi:hypothetical protein